MTKAERQKIYREKHPDKINAYQREYYHINREKIILRRKKIRDGHKESECKRVSEYYTSHPDKRREKGKRDYIAMSLNHKIASSLRRRIRASIRQDNKTMSMISLLGCTVNEFKKYIETQFKPGMSWENYGAWHIDHKQPCAYFDLSNVENQKQCFHFTNLQPLWAIENIKKGSTITDGFGNFWPLRCPMCQKNKMEIVRPGKVQCRQCG